MKDTPKTPKEAETAFFSLLLQKNNGQSCIDDFLNELKAKKAFSDPKAYSRLKAKLYEILTAANGEDSELMAELETAIADIAKYTH